MFKFKNCLTCIRRNVVPSILPAILLSCLFASEGNAQIATEDEKCTSLKASGKSALTKKTNELAPIANQLLYELNNGVSVKVRGCAAIGLGNMGKQADQNVVNNLKNALTYLPSESVRCNAAIALGALAASQPPQIALVIRNDLVTQLNSNRAEGLRTCAAEGLGRMENSADDVVLTALLNTFNYQRPEALRCAAAQALGTLASF